MASSPQHEPTMEEILASIRKIISEDAPEAPPPAAPAAAAPAHEDSDVLELTQEVHDEPAPPAPEPVVITPPAPMPEPLPEPAPVVAAALPAPEPEPVKQPENDVVFQTIEEEVPVSSEAQAVAPHEGIFSDKTRKAMDDSFASIQTPAKPDVAPVEEAAPAPQPAADGSSVQDVFEKAVRDSFEPVVRKWLGEHSDDVVDKLKPLVREWMDEHFPALLEGAVRAEVERVARARH